MHVADAVFKRLHHGPTDSNAPTSQLNLLRWISIVSFLLISVITFELGAMATRLLVTESLERDSLPIPADHSHA